MKVAKNEQQTSGLPLSLKLFMNRNQNLLQLGLVTIAILVLMSLLNPGLFLTKKNILAMGYQIPELGLLALAIMTTMLLAGIDLSVVGIANLSAVLAALVFTKLMPKEATGGEAGLYMVLAVAVAMATGLACGLLNGVLVARFKIPDILATLGTMEVFTGISVVLTKGTAIFGVPASFVALGNGTLMGLPVPLYIFAAFAIAFAVLFNRTSYGFELYMQGTNPAAARFSGINTAMTTIKTYALSGLLAATAGLVILARTNSAKADYGAAYTLQAIVVAVLGGVNPFGGFGTVTGLVLSLLSLQFLSTGFNMLRIGGSASQYAREMVWGVVLLLVMVLNYYNNRKAGRRE